MAYILCIETATTVCSVCLTKDGNVLSLVEADEGYMHAEHITVFIQRVCRDSNIELNAIDAVAVSRGPGSYTGLRIGASTAKGLCYALQKPLIAIDTLKSLSSCYLSANVAAPSTILVPMLDARRMEVYCAVYDAGLKELFPAEAVVVNENSFEKQLNHNRTVFFGNGSWKCRPLLKDHPNAVFADVPLSATGLVPLAEELFMKKDFEDVSLFEPFYLKEVAIGKKKN